MKKRLEDFEPLSIKYKGKNLKQLSSDECFAVAYSAMCAMQAKPYEYTEDKKNG